MKKQEEAAKLAEVEAEAEEIMSADLTLGADSVPEAAAVSDGVEAAELTTLADEQTAEPEVAAK